MLLNVALFEDADDRRRDVVHGCALLARQPARLDHLGVDERVRHGLPIEPALQNRKLEGVIHTAMQ